ncbi:MAG TPA: HAD hydrolase family protein [Bacteroidales bacterium]|jgi:soluble P-type ATPase|nr:HAD hydrolase family protein [Bacteroidales bacterium]HOU97725.1 HAD hydrolase family protein [Bacteroidales bacterium]
MAIEIVFNPLEQYHIEHVIFDYNGTLAIDGEMIEGVEELLKRLAEQVSIHVVTADTFKMAAEQLKKVPVKLTILKNGQEKQQKLFYLENLGREKCIAIGNGTNDAMMLAKAPISIAVIQSEGTSQEALNAAKIVCPNILDAIALCLKPKRIVATLRK